MLLCAAFEIAEVTACWTACCAICAASINAGASSNYVVSTTAKAVAPTTTAGTVAASAALDANQATGIWTNTTVRQRIASSAISAGSGPVTITLTTSTIAPLMIGAAYIGQAASAGSYAFASTPTQLTFSGASGTGLIPAGGSITSDPASFTIPAGVDLVVSFYVSGTSGNDGARVKGTQAGWNAYWKAGDDAATVGATGYVAASNPAVILSSVNRSVGINNMAIVTTTQTPDATVSMSRVLLEYNPVDATTLNTDLTVEVTCNGGSTWAAAALAAAGTAQAGHKVAETADTACTGGGASFAARIKTLNNKNIQIYKTTVTVH